jgi:type II secretory pathway component PulK
MKRRDDGFVLVCVLWVMAILTVLSIGLGRRALLDARAAAYAADHSRARHMARSAVEYGIAATRNERAFQSMAAGLPPGILTPAFSSPATSAAGANLLKDDNLFSIGGNRIYDDDECRYTVKDEERRIAVNTVPEAILEEIPGISFVTVEDILRQRDEAKSADKEALAFVTIGEIRALEGMNDRLWEGSGDGAAVRDLLTVWGDGRINVNTASEDVLACVPGVTSTVLAAIVALRAGPDDKPGTPDDVHIRDLAAISGQLGMSAEQFTPIRKYCKVDSEFLTITGVATLRGGKVRATCQAVVRMNEEDVAVLEWREGPLGS